MTGLACVQNLNGIRPAKGKNAVCKSSPHNQNFRLTLGLTGLEIKVLKRVLGTTYGTFKAYARLCKKKVIQKCYFF